MVSVIIRTKDRERFLARALDSVAAQTHQDLEVVLVNNALQPLSLIKKYPFPISIVEGQGTFSLAAAINAGIQRAQGNLIALLDDDDTWDPAYLSNHVGFLKDHPECAGSASLTEIRLEEIRPDGDVLLSSKPFNHHCCTRLSCLLYHNRFTTNAFVYRKEEAMRVGLYDVSLNELEDWDFNIKMAIRYRIGALKGYWSRYHKRPKAEGTQGNTSMERHLQADRIIRMRILGNPEISIHMKAYAMACWGLVLFKRVLKGRK